MNRLFVAALTPLALTGCNQKSAEPPAANVATPAAAGNYAARVEALPTAQLNGTLFRAIRDSGGDCQEVTGSNRQSDINGQPSWTATCDERNVWLVSFKDDGTATVTRQTG